MHENLCGKIQLAVLHLKRDPDGNSPFQSTPITEVDRRSRSSRRVARSCMRPRYYNILMTLMRPYTVPVASQRSPVKNSQMTDLLLRDDRLATDND